MRGTPENNGRKGFGDMEYIEVSAKTVDDAIMALNADSNSEVISGGTDVLIRVREGRDAGKSLVSIHNIEELKGIEMEEDGTIVIKPAVPPYSSNIIAICVLCCCISLKRSFIILLCGTKYGS